MLCCYLKTSHLLESNLSLILPGIQGNTGSRLLGQSDPRLLRVPVCPHNRQGLSTGILLPVTHGPAGFLKWSTLILYSHVFFSLNNKLSLKLEVQHKNFLSFQCRQIHSIKVT